MKFIIITKNNNTNDNKSKLNQKRLGEEVMPLQCLSQEQMHDSMGPSWSAGKSWPMASSKKSVKINCLIDSQPVFFF